MVDKRFVEKYGLVLTVIGSLIVVGAVVVGAYHEFVTEREYSDDKAVDHERRVQIKTDLLIKIAQNAQEIAGVSLNQQAISCRQEIKNLERDIREFRKKHGSPPYGDADVQGDWEKLQADLKAERDFCAEVRGKIRK